MNFFPAPPNFFFSRAISSRKYSCGLYLAITWSTLAVSIHEVNLFFVTCLEYLLNT